MPIPRLHGRHEEDREENDLHGLNANFRGAATSIASNGGTVMRRILLALCLLAVATTLSASGRYRNHGISASIDDDDLVNNCGAVRVTFNDRPAIRAEESVPVGSQR